MNRPTLPLAVLTSLIVLGPTGAADAATSSTWTQRERKDFAEAQLDGVSIAEDGSLRLAAGVTASFEVPQPNLWCLAADSTGRVYVGGGNDGRVYRMGPESGEAEIVFDSDQIAIQAIAIDSRDRLYAASSPEGSIWRIEEGKEPAIVDNPGSVFIWALLMDRMDRLYAATGTPGRVLRIDTRRPGAAAEVVLETTEDHIRSLALADDGTVYAGSDGGGVIYRIPPAGAPSVVYDTPMREIAAIAVEGPGGRDRVYAAAIGPLPGGRARPGADGGSGGGEGVTRVRVTAEGEEEDDEEAQPTPQQEPRRPAVHERYYGSIYAVEPGGYAKAIWESRQQLPLSLAILRHGTGAPEGVLVGTADQGDVILLGSSAEASAFVTIPSQQVNALVARSDGTILAAASNLGRVVRIRPGGQRAGEVISAVHDAGFTSSWGAISWTADVPRGGEVRFQTRTGDTERPDGTWSAWSEELGTPEGTLVPSPRARFVQWRAILRASPSGASPVVRAVTLGYLQDNMPPEIANVEVQPPGLVLSGSPGGTGDSNGVPVSRQRVQPRRSFQKGMRSVSWSAEDSNEDDLTYDVEFMAEDESLWKPLAKGLTAEFHSWDETSMPDGVYRIRIQASDAPSNPPGTERTAVRLSPAFDVDNTPPVVGSPRFRALGNGGTRSGEVQVAVHDTFSPIASVAWSLDAGPWVPVHPVDGIADSVEESYRFPLEGLVKGEHTVTVRATDKAGNTGASRVVIRVE